MVGGDGGPGLDREMVMYSLFAVAGVLVMVWFGLVFAFISALRNRHPELLERYNPMVAPFAFFGFIFSNRDLELQDPQLSSVVRAMRVVLPAYFLIFAAMILTFFQLQGSQ